MIVSAPIFRWYYGNRVGDQKHFIKTTKNILGQSISCERKCFYMLIEIEVCKTIIANMYISYNVKEESEEK